jgi:hypothetical protein
MNLQEEHDAEKEYTVKKIYRIPVFFFTKPFRNGKTPMLTRDFLVPSREGIFCLLRRKKYSSLCSLQG